MDLPCTIRLLDGEERGLPPARFEEYTNFRLRTVNMSNTIEAPPNRTVDYNVCENYFAHGHRCLGDAFEACQMPPPYRSQAGSTTVPPKKGSSDSTSSSKSSKIKEVKQCLSCISLKETSFSKNVSHTVLKHFKHTCKIHYLEWRTF